ncbi:MAG TPA: glycosyltransferase [Bacillota bacterium]|nr:glycosyltransferase [Bacillota bacterium]
MTDKKKVVHMTTVHHPFDTRIYHKECQSLQQAGFDVSLITQIDPKAIPENEDIHFIPLKKRKRRLQRMLLSTWEAYRKAKRTKADCYHIHDPELLPVGWLLKTKDNTVIYDIHEDYVTSITQKDYMIKIARSFFARVYQFAEKLFSRKMNLCLAEKYYADKYPNGICILNYPKINDKLMSVSKESQPIEDKLLYTGNVSVDRGAFIHARLLTLDPSITIHCIGKCPGSLAQEMATLAGDEADRLHIEGIDTFIEREAIDDKYIERNWLAGLALFPPTEHYMRKELTKFFEYMVAEIPIICSDFPVWRAFMERYECGLAVNPDNADEVRNAIRYLRENPNEARRMGHNGKRAVMEKLNWKHEAKILIHWYNDLLGTSATGASPESLNME